MAEPIAIVGRACLLPGAADPEALARAVLGGVDLLRDVPPGRWRLDPARLRGAPPDRDDRTWSLRGGYVDGFTLDPAGLAVAPERLAGADPVLTWTLHVLRAALRDAGRARGGPGVGLVLGNLSFPTLGLAHHAASVWLGPHARAAGLPAVDPRDRFMSGLPARLAAEALDLRAGATCLDAACASGLYAVALACEALRAGRADLMLAGAVQAADDLFLHVGFTALAALSPSGRSRPFHREADGLVPAEGAAAVALRRLADAERDGDRVLAVIRGVGLANDGRGRGLLAPCPEGQVRAMRRAYAQAGVRPRDIGLLECHATGTVVGDAAELRSAAEVFAGHPGLPIGSIKGNLGHALTVAGLAGLLKVVACLEAGVRAPTLHADDPAPGLRDAPLRLLTAAEPWPADGPRRAAVSAFGFGGNNAHLVVEAWTPPSRRRPPAADASRESPRPTDDAGPPREPPRSFTDEPRDEPPHSSTDEPRGEPPHSFTDEPRGEPPHSFTDEPRGEPPHSFTDDESRREPPHSFTDESLREPPCPIAVVGLGVRVGDCETADEFADVLLGPPLAAPRSRMDVVRIARADLRFPPADLRHALGQQTAVLAAAIDAMAARTGAAVAGERAGVIVGMGCDPEVARAGARWRSAAWADELARAGLPADAAWAARAADGFLAPLRAPDVLGMMPNLVANRIGSHFDLGGPGFTVSAEEASGLVALAEAARLLRRGEVDLMIAAAVDLSCEPVHAAARAALGAADPPADAAVALVLRRLADARRDGDSVLAVLPDEPADGPALVDENVVRPDAPAVARPEHARADSDTGAVPDAPVARRGRDLAENDVVRPDAPADSDTGAVRRDAAVARPGRALADDDRDLVRLADDLGVERRFGRAHAAAGLLRVAAAVLCLRRGVLPSARGPRPWLSEGTRRARVEIDALGGPPAAALLHAGDDPPPFIPRPPALAVFAAPDLGSLRAALARGAQHDPATRREHHDPAARREQHDPAAHGEQHDPARDERDPAAVRLAVLADDPADLPARCLAAAAALPADLPSAAVTALAPGVYLGHGSPGELAFVYPGAAAAYPDMGRAVLLAFPRERDALWRAIPGLRDMAEWTWTGAAPATPMHQLWGCSFVCQLHARVLQDVLGLRPAAAIGYSSGETNALFAHGAWTDIARMLAQTRDDALFRSELCGPADAAQRAWRRAGLPTGAWQSWCVAAPVWRVRAALAGEPQAHLTIVNTAADCVIGGHADACRRVLARLPGAGVRPLGYAIVAHAPELAEAAPAWRALHRRPTRPIARPRIYGAAAAAAYAPTESSAEEALLGQAIRTLDFPAVITRAHTDGARIFLELGPRGLCRGWIAEILAGRPHLALALDRPGRDALHSLWDCVGQLVAAGVPLDLAALRRALPPARPPAPPREALALPAHLPPVALPPLARRDPPAPVPNDLSPRPATPMLLPRPPRLPRVADHDRDVPRRAATLTAPVDTLPAAPPQLDDSPHAASQPARVDAAPVTPHFDDSHHAAPQSAEVDATPVTPHLDDSPHAASRSVIAEAATVTPVDDSPHAASRPVSAGAAPVTPVDDSPHAVSRSVIVDAPTAARAAPLEPFAPSPLAHALAAGMHAVTATHRAYLATQAEVQRRFLALAAVATPRLALVTPSLEAPALVVPQPPSSRSATPTLAAPAPVLPQPSARPATPSLDAPALVASQPALALAPPARPGPKFTRRELEDLSRGRISRHFGPRFAAQDHHLRQVRMPTPPLLLADRVTGIDGEPGSLGRGTIWTETDVGADAWYLHDGVMPAGLVVEAGQADLLLLSWLGVDLENQGERVYRLLGCELTYYGVPVRPGDTLAYEIHIDGYAVQGGVRLAFFRHDCTVGGALRMRVTGGRAGFFTDAELAGSQGVLWDPHGEAIDGDARLDAPAVRCQRRGFSRAHIDAFADGDAAACFGPGFERARTHTRTPRIARGDLQLIHAVTDFDPTGGPWRRGYLRATYALAPDTWFFASHFAGDPCMPGTLMCEGLMQAMAIYLAALGATLPRDGWRFEPVPGVRYQLRCRGQVTPASREVVYEVFVAEYHAGPVPTLVADILCSVDGLRAFHCRRMGLRLVPDWPLTSLPAAAPDPAPAAEHDGVRFDRASLLACALGPATAAFGPRFAAFDGPRRLARLPGPPYHFMTRVAALDAARVGAPAGASVEVVYAVPPDAWYFAGPRPVMPFAVLLEVALQPCGWLAMAHGTAVRAAEDLYFRNLDGRAVLHADVGPDAGELRTRVEHLGTADSGGITLVQFAVTCSVGARRVLELRTGFGFFPAAALAQQAGLPVLAEHRRWRDEPADTAVDLRRREPYRDLEPVPSGMLRMLDRVTGWWPDAGAAGLGRARAELDVDAGQWFFKAHFFQDPVMPGSLGLQAMLQLLHWVMLRRGLAAGLAAPRFEALQTGAPTTWTYRGQILPETARMAIDLEVQAIDAEARTATAVASLWADGARIYQATLPARLTDAAPAIGEQAAPVGADGRVDLEAVRRFWAGRTGVSGWLLEDLVLGLVRRFVGRVHLPRAPLPRGALLLANHEVAVESLLLCPLYGAWSGSPTVALAKAEHRASWLGGLMSLARSHPAAEVPSFLAFFDRGDRASLPALLEQLHRDVLAPGGSLLIHVEGTRARSCRHRPRRVGAAVLELAARHRLPVVPVRFVGGLPVEPAPAALDFPLGYGAQDIHVGAPIAADELAALPPAGRAARVLAAITALGPDPEHTDACAPAPAFAEEVARRARESGAPAVVAALAAVLRECPAPSRETRVLLGEQGADQLPPAVHPWLETVRALLAPR